MSIILSNLPGLNNAGSSISDRFVAPKTMTFESVLNPSNSTNNWFKVLSLYEFPAVTLPEDLFLPIASI